MRHRLRLQSCHSKAVMYLISSVSCCLQGNIPATPAQSCGLSSASATRCRGLVIKFIPWAMRSKNLLSCRAKFFLFYVYIAYPSGKGCSSLNGLCPHCFHQLLCWAFVEGRVFLPTKYCTPPSAVSPWRQVTCSYELDRRRKSLSCNPSVFISTSLTFGIPTLNTARSSLPAPRPGMG